MTTGRKKCSVDMGVWSITAAWKAFLLLFALEQASGLWQRVIVMCFRDYALEQALGGMAAAYGILFRG